MPQHGLWRPLAVILIGLALTFSLLVRTEGAPQRQQSLEDYPEPTRTALVQQTQTAAANFGSNQTGYPPAQGGTPTSDTPQQPTQTTTTTTETVRTTVTATLETITPTLATPTLAGQTAAPAATPQPTETPTKQGAIECTPGVPLTVSGEGPPYAPVLLYFDRRVVGGGSVKADGSFTLPLVIGSERAGDHEISVRLRGSTEVLTEFTCTVPAVTPTPIPGRRTFP